MSAYSSELTIRQALNQFFKEHNLGEEGGLHKNWAWLRLGKFYIPFPNTKSRKKALVFHDIHHLVTGYQSDWKGEAQISAWEISSGCGDYIAAWVLDIWGFFIGLVFFPRATFRAFIRGRRTLNLYKHQYLPESLMSMSIAEIQVLLKLNTLSPEPATANEMLDFAKWAGISVAAFAVPFILPYVILAWWLFFRH